MRVTTISFQQTFPTGNFSNNKLGVEIELGENENPVEVFEEVKKMVNVAFEKMNPQIQWEQPMFHPRTQEEQPTDKIDSFISTINYCTNIKFLENFKKRVDEENIPKLTEAYYKKLKTFQ